MISIVARGRQASGRIISRRDSSLPPKLNRLFVLRRWAGLIGAIHGDKVRHMDEYNVYTRNSLHGKILAI